MKSDLIRIATRGSKLALWQANYVASLLQMRGYQCTLNVVSTEGDRIQNRFLHEIGGKGLFVRELERALLHGEADIAVHSLKDLPVKQPETFVIAAVLGRHSPRDVLVLKAESMRKLGSPENGLTKAAITQAGNLIIATSSLRRQALIRSANQRVQLLPVRGNVDTRLDKLFASDWDGIILAEASLERLSLKHLPHLVLDSQWFVPSPAQGALCIETVKNSPSENIVKGLADDATMFQVAVERKVLELLGGDCTMPVGCYVRPEQNSLVTDTVVLDYEGNFAASRIGFAQTENLSVNEMAEVILKELESNDLDRILTAIKESKPPTFR